MEHLNYCRQMVTQFTTSLKKPGFPKENAEILSHYVDLANASMKFIMPLGGRLLDDKELRGLDENEPLRLPHQFIAIEYERERLPENEHERQPSKGLLFARERDGWIVISICAWLDDLQMWGPMPEASIPQIGFLDRNAPLNRGRVPMRISSPQGLPNTDYADEAGALLDLLNALACSNVQAVRSRARKVAKKAKSALPFDDYHVLMIESHESSATNGLGLGTHRSPREHLRRGHIRRLADKRIWVNATIVAAGRGAGIVRKDYALGQRSHAV